MIERKVLDICRRCGEFRKGETRSGYRLFMCDIERTKKDVFMGRTMDGYSIWNKLSTFLYPEPPMECPYYAEHLVCAGENVQAAKARELHEMLGFGRK